MLKVAHALALVILFTASPPPPPAGRPPIGPLERYDPRIYDMLIEVSVRTDISPQVRHRTNVLRWEYVLADAEIYMPVILQSTFNEVEKESITASLWLLDHEVPGIREEMRLDDAQPMNTHRVTIPIRSFEGERLRWRTTYRTQVWSSRINDAMAAKVDWPEEWPVEVRDALRPQTYVESNDPLFIAAIERITGGIENLQNAPPYYAAKEIIRNAIQSVQVEGSGEHRGNLSVLTGININGAKRAAQEGRGTSHDLVAVCVAMLRAADIPARPVIGVQRRMSGDGRRRGTHQVVSWAEFYLPGAGWVPFDPVSMRGKAMHRRVDEQWPEFGSIKDLNTRVPLAYHFTPQGSAPAPEHPAVWGWNPRNPAGAPVPRSKQEIRLSMAYQGRGAE